MGLGPEYVVSESQLKEVVGGIARGSYTEIVGITTPSEAAAGDTVSLEVTVKNIWTSPFYIAVTGRYDGGDIAFNPDYANVGAGQTYSFTSSFTMPNSDVRLDVWSFYWTGTEWYQDDHDYVNIALAAAPSPEFRGFGVNEYIKV
jgi:subtilase family serine protease